MLFVLSSLVTLSMRRTWALLAKLTRRLNDFREGLSWICVSKSVVNSIDWVALVVSGEGTGGAN